MALAEMRLGIPHAAAYHELDHELPKDGEVGARRRIRECNEILHHTCSQLSTAGTEVRIPPPHRRSPRIYAIWYCRREHWRGLWVQGVNRGSPAARMTRELR